MNKVSHHHHSRRQDRLIAGSRGLEKGTPLKGVSLSSCRKPLAAGERGAVKIFRAAVSDEQAKAIAHRIKAIDYELIALVTGDGNANHAPLNLRAAARLARIQRDLRALRIDMEVERRFDTMPMAVPRHQSQAPWGGPELWGVFGDRRGEVSAVFATNRLFYNGLGIERGRA